MSFNNIIGEEVPKKILQNSLQTGRISSAYLFKGEEGVGKSSVALIFAKALNCTLGVYDSCDTCEVCTRIDKGSEPDLIKILPEGNILIDEIRFLKKWTSLKPYRKFKVAIIKDADRMTEEASNAFLKILEEPPTRVVFILTTTRPHALPLTIRSRCQHVPFRKLTKEEIELFLKKEKRLESEKLKLIAALAAGSIGRALRLLDEEELRKLSFEFFKALPERRLNYIERLKAEDANKFLYYFVSFYRDLMFMTLDYKDRIRNYDLIPELDGSKISMDMISKGIEICEQVSESIKRNIDKQLLLYYLTKNLP